ncbi:MAG: hypothetical protein ABEK01_02310 [Candidatus Nanohaloarchaea archaeon]
MGEDYGDKSTEELEEYEQILKYELDIVQSDLIDASKKDGDLEEAGEELESVRDRLEDLRGELEDRDEEEMASDVESAIEYAEDLQQKYLGDQSE